MNFMYSHYIIYMEINHLRAYHRPTQRLAPSQPDSSSGRALHRHRRDLGSSRRITVSSLT